LAGAFNAMDFPKTGSDRDVRRGEDVLMTTGEVSH
jgi:hypothetical protein